MNVQRFYKPSTVKILKKTDYVDTKSRYTVSQVLKVKYKLNTLKHRSTDVHMPACVHKTRLVSF